MKSPVKKVTISNPEGHMDYVKKFPVEFNSFEAANKFLQDHQEFHTKGGYDKHNVRVEWENGDVYEYRADISHPAGNCFHSLEYNIGARVKQGLQKFAKEDEAAQRMLENCKTSSLNIEFIEARDKEIRKYNQEVQEREQYEEEFKALLQCNRDSYNYSVAHEEEDTVTNFQGGVTVSYVKGKHIRWTGVNKITHTHSREVHPVQFGQIYKVGDTARVERYVDGEITKITDKSVMIKTDQGNRRLTHRDFFYSNLKRRVNTESEEHHHHMMEIYSR